jgi:GNAT superfamily N-acetyltransferase
MARPAAPSNAVSRFVFRVQEAQRLVGWRKLPWSVVSWRLCRRYRVLTRDLGVPVPPRTAPAELRWGPLGPSEGPRFLALYPRITAEELSRRWGEGQTAEGAWLGGDLVHFRWDASGDQYPLPYLSAVLALSGRELAVSFTFTHPAHRGRGIAAASIVRALERARARGCTRAITLVSPFNGASLRAFDKAGFRAVGTAGYWQTGLRVIPFARGAVTLSAGNVFRVNL